MGKSDLFLVCMVVIIICLGLAASHILLRPFKNLQSRFDRVTPGDLDADIAVDPYKETRRCLRQWKSPCASSRQWISPGRSLCLMYPMS